MKDVQGGIPAFGTSIKHRIDDGRDNVVFSQWRDFMRLLVRSKASGSIRCLKEEER